MTESKNPSTYPFTHDETLDNNNNFPRTLLGTGSISSQWPAKHSHPLYSFLSRCIFLQTHFFHTNWHRIIGCCMQNMAHLTYLMKQHKNRFLSHFSEHFLLNFCAIEQNFCNKSSTFCGQPWHLKPDSHSSRFTRFSLRKTLSIFLTDVTRLLGAFHAPRSTHLLPSPHKPPHCIMSRCCPFGGSLTKFRSPSH